MLRCCGSRRPTSRCPTTSSSSASRSLPLTAWSLRRAASSTSTDACGHQCLYGSALPYHGGGARGEVAQAGRGPGEDGRDTGRDRDRQDRKSTRLNSSHSQISYAVFCLKKKKKKTH